MSNNDFSRESLTDLLARLLVFAQKAGERILAVYEGSFRIDTKTDKSPVTEADMGAHEVVVNGLQDLPRAYPVLSEESVDIPFSARRRWDTYWLVDPLDGTREFIKRNGEFTVNIALIHHQESILGLIYPPRFRALLLCSSWLRCVQTRRQQRQTPTDSLPQSRPRTHRRGGQSFP